jgi:hypothetical protein
LHHGQAIWENSGVLWEKGEAFTTTITPIGAFLELDYCLKKTKNRPHRVDFLFSTTDVQPIEYQSVRQNQLLLH